jgi:hypothetical protein
MNLYEQTKGLWGARAQSLSLRWAESVQASIHAIETSSKQFREWRPLRFYLSVGQAAAAAGRSGVEYSVRFRGQEVATLRVGATRQLRCSPKHQENNLRYFKIQKSPNACEWGSADAVAFRRAFRDLESAKTVLSVRSPEHSVETRFIEEMLGNSSKFANSFRDIQPVGIAGFPFQCPVPLSASGGSPKPTRGNIDILARRGRGRGTKLSVWELKAPRALAHAVEQAYIYAVTLALMLRAPGGLAWYHTFGFSSATLPTRLALEAVVAVTEDQRPKVEKAARRLVQSTPLVLPGENVTLSLHAAYYDKQTLKIDFRDLL